MTDQPLTDGNHSFAIRSAEQENSLLFVVQAKLSTKVKQTSKQQTHLRSTLRSANTVESTRARESNTCKSESEELRY
jgi:hypothetical protein